MIERLKAPSAEGNLKRLERVTDISFIWIEDFVTSKSCDMLKALGILIDPASWNNNESYQKAKVTINGLRVVNDCAERVVALITQYNDVLSKNEEQRQYLLQVVQEHRHKFKTAKKCNLVASTTTDSTNN